jgi:hypothetical protein
MQSALRHVSFAFFCKAYFVQRKVSPPDLVVAPALEQGVPFLTVAALAGAAPKASAMRSEAVAAAMTLRNMKTSVVNVLIITKIALKSVKFL